VQSVVRKAAEWQDVTAGPDRHGHRWAVDVFLEKKTPALLIVGELDERWLIDAYLLAARMHMAGRRDFALSVYPNLGHQLGPELAGEVIHPQHGVIAHSRTGPIDPQVVTEIIEWLQAHTKSAPPAPP
jgi:hypothetical protein